jgi:catechol 2,3-dioxygenase-like lactoylglutathione lyase family enzyme
MTGNARIRHIALGAIDTEKAAQFYVQTFGMQIVHRHPGKRIKGRDAFYVSDGHLNLAILPAGEGRPAGINHFGFQVDNMEATSDLAVENGARQGIKRREAYVDGQWAGTTFAEAGIVDPIGVGIDLSEQGWRVEKFDDAPESPQDSAVPMGRIRHIALGSNDPASLARFYVETFGMQLVHRHPGLRFKGTEAFYVSDGYINLAILPAGEGRPEGLNHFGFQVESMQETSERAVATSAQRGIKEKDSYVDGKWAGNNFAEASIADPEGIFIDLSEKGWKLEPTPREG